MTRLLTRIEIRDLHKKNWEVFEAFFFSFGMFSLLFSYVFLELFYKVFGFLIAANCVKCVIMLLMLGHCVLVIGGVETCPFEYRLMSSRRLFIIHSFFFSAQCLCPSP